MLKHHSVIVVCSDYKTLICQTYHGVFILKPQVTFQIPSPICECIVISDFTKPTPLISVANSINISNGEKEHDQYDPGKRCEGT